LAHLLCLLGGADKIGGEIFQPSACGTKVCKISSKQSKDFGRKRFGRRKKCRRVETGPRGKGKLTHLRHGERQEDWEFACQEGKGKASRYRERGEKKR